MTTSSLLIFIVAAIATQTAILAAVAFKRHWKSYARLQALGESGSAAGSAPARAEARAPGGPAWTGLREFRVAHVATEDRAGLVRSYELVPCDGRFLPPFEPGQFLTFELKIADATRRMRTVVRCYSLSDRPHADHYRVTVKRVSHSRPGVASTHFHDQVQVGSTLQVRAPSGHFRLDTDATPLVLIAGGIGITPLASMIHAVLDGGGAREVHLFYGVRNGSQHAMKAALEALARMHANFHLHVCYSRPAADDRAGIDYQHAGHIDIGLLRQTLPLRAHRFYVCGPRAMLESLLPALRAWGVREDHIHYEAFGPASLGGAPTVRGDRTVTFASSGKRIAWVPGCASLLEFAESHGIALASGCRAGGCGTCQTMIEAGEIEYGQTPEFDPEVGSCLMCIARPKTDLVLAA